MEEVTITVKRIESPLPTTERTSRFKISEDREDGNSTDHQLDLTDNYRTSQLTAAHVLFLSIHETYNNSDHNQGSIN